MRGFIFGKNPSFAKSTLKFENKIYTVKSSEENGQRIYSVEREELEKYQ